MPDKIKVTTSKAAQLIIHAIYLMLSIENHIKNLAPLTHYKIGITPYDFWSSMDEKTWSLAQYDK